MTNDDIRIKFHIKRNSPAMTMDIPRMITGNMLKQRVQYNVQKLPEDQQLFFQTSENEEWKQITDNETLDSQGLVADAHVCEGDMHETKEGTSALRENIKANGKNSYYYAHASETKLPDEIRFVSGGEPIKMEPSPKKEDGEVKTKPVRQVAKYAWSNEESQVKIYLTDEECVKAAQEVKDVSEFTLRVDGENSDQLVFEFEAQTARYSFKVPLNDGASIAKPLRVASSKLSITLKKLNETHWSSLGKTN